MNNVTFYDTMLVIIGWTLVAGATTLLHRCIVHQQINYGLFYLVFLSFMTALTCDLSLILVSGRSFISMVFGIHIKRQKIDSEIVYPLKHAPKSE